jgi:hypothetical protein
MIKRHFGIASIPFSKNQFHASFKKQTIERCISPSPDDIIKENMCINTPPIVHPTFTRSINVELRDASNPKEYSKESYSVQEEEEEEVDPVCDWLSNIDWDLAFKMQSEPIDTHRLFANGLIPNHFEFTDSPDLTCAVKPVAERALVYATIERLGDEMTESSISSCTSCPDMKKMKALMADDEPSLWVPTEHLKSAFSHVLGAEAPINVFFHLER